MSEQPTKFCKDCANFKSPNLCYIGNNVNVITGETLPEYISCETARSPYLKHPEIDCAPHARRFVQFDPAKAPAHRSSLGFIMDRFWHNS